MNSNFNIQPVAENVSQNYEIARLMRQTGFPPPNTFDLQNIIFIAREVKETCPDYLLPTKYLLKQTVACFKCFFSVI